MQIDRRDDAHVALPPLAMAVRHLSLDYFERVQAHVRLRHFQRLLEDVGEFVLHHQELAVCFVLGEFLQGAELVDGGKKVAPGVVGYWVGGELGDGKTELVDFRRLVARGGICGW